jgi:hypothetical protein
VNRMTGSIPERFRSLSLSFALYHCSGMYRSYEFRAKVGKLLDSLPRNDAVTDLCCGKFNVAGLLP